jgi:protein translocase SecG subunit
MGMLFMIVQAIAAVVMITMILIQTTKSEQSGSTGGGWGVIGGKSTSSIRTRWGVEEHLGRITMWVAISFLCFSALASVWRMHNW